MDACSLTKMILKLPTNGVNLIPSRSLTCDVNTWIAQPVVNPETNVSDNSDDIIPSLSTYIMSWKINSIRREKKLVKMDFELYVEKQFQSN